MRRSLSLFPMLLLAFLFAAPLAAQGPPAGVPGGGLTAALEALADRVDTLEDRADVLTAENAAQAAQIAAIELLLAQTDRSIPTGTVMPFAGPASAVPDGWLLCDGTEVDRLLHMGRASVVMCRERHPGSLGDLGQRPAITRSDVARGIDQPADMRLDPRCIGLVDPQVPLAIRVDVW